MTTQNQIDACTLPTSTTITMTWPCANCGGFIKEGACIVCGVPEGEEPEECECEACGECCGGACGGKDLEASDAEWRKEIAMEAGMGMGCDAYNEVMGWD